MMEEEIDRSRRFERYDQESVFSTTIRAGKRTYYFDVKSTHRDDFFLVVTESKKRFSKDGRIFFEKHKVYIYKEDFDNFANGLAEAMEYIDNYDIDNFEEDSNNDANELDNYTNVEFDDLESSESSENHTHLKA